MLKQIDKRDALKQWYLNYINCFREEYEKLSLDEKKGMKNTNNFLDPCQVEVFWISDPDYQLIVQSNFNDRSDREILINGPYRPHEFHSNVVAILEDERWARRLEPDSWFRQEELDTLGKRMALEIYKFVEMRKYYVFESDGENNHALMGMKVENTWTCMRAGNIGELDHIQEVGKTVQEIKRDAKHMEEKKPISQPSEPPANDDYAGFGVHLFPPVVIGTKHKRSIEELIRNSYDLVMPDKVLHMTIDDNPIIVYNDGFIFVDRKNKEHAMKVLNLIMACGALYGLPLYAVREHELVAANYDRRNLTLTSMQWSSETRRAYLLENRFNQKHTSRMQATLEPGVMQKILSSAEKILACEKLAEDMRLLNESRTHFANFEFAPSFVMSWSVVERHYADLWNNLLVQKNVAGKRFNKLTNPGLWTFDHILETFNLSGGIDEPSYVLLIELKRKRNNFYHGGKQITKNDAERCLEYAIKILYATIKA